MRLNREILPIRDFKLAALHGTVWMLLLWAAGHPIDEWAVTVVVLYVFLWVSREVVLSVVLRATGLLAKQARRVAKKLDIDVPNDLPTKPSSQATLPSYHRAGVDIHGRRWRVVDCRDPCRRSAGPSAPSGILQLDRMGAFWCRAGGAVPDHRGFRPDLRRGGGSSRRPGNHPRPCDHRERSRIHGKSRGILAEHPNREVPHAHEQRRHQDSSR